MSIFLACRQIKPLMLRINRPAKLRSAAVTHRYFWNKAIDQRIDDRRPGEDQCPDPKRMPPRRENQKRHARNDDDPHSQLLREILADKQVAATAIWAGFENLRGFLPHAAGYKSRTCGRFYKPAIFWCRFSSGLFVFTRVRINLG